MKTRFFTLFIAATMLIGMMSGCSVTDVLETPTNPESSAATDPEQISADTTGVSVSNLLAVSNLNVSTVTDKLKDEDSDSSWSAASSTKITLNGTTATVSGSGAAASGGTVTITKAGTYVVSGTLTKGQIYINAGKNDTVRLVLNGANITAAQNAAIYAAQADKLIIILADASVNKVTDAGTAFTYADTTAEEPDAAIFSKCDLSITGGGSLTVNAGFNNGIGTKDDLVITGGKFVINAENHGIRGRDSVTITGGSFDITAGNDGIQSNNDEDATKGWVNLAGGTFKITAGHDGVQAETDLLISGGEYTIITGGSAAKNASVDTSDSYKGIKASGNISISGGTFTIDSADDTIHANGNVSISGGNFTLSSGDDGIHADSDLTISGGNINITKSYEGLEGNNVYIKNGTVSVVASDDGINAAGGTDGSGTGGRFGGDKFASGGNHSINISGGIVKVIASSDGLDSNGTISISGGMVITQSIAARDGDALDADGTVTFTGGTVVYAGTINTGINPSGSSTQSYVYVAANINAGSNITVKKNGKTLISYKPDANIKYLALSSPDIKSGESYEIYNGSTLVATATAGTGGGGMGGMGGKQGPGGTGGKQR